MSQTLSPTEIAKFVCAKRAARFVENGMTVGLGTGSTAVWLVRCLGAMVRDDGLSFRGVPTSSRTAQQARTEGIEIISLDEAGRLDLTIDGADEFDAAFDLIKGGGGAHLHEKIVASASDRMVVIADTSKEVGTLGAFPLPLEVIPFGWKTTQRLVETCLTGMDVEERTCALRMQGEIPYVTDEGNHVIDLHLKKIGDAAQLASALNQIPGVVENGLFIGLCDAVVLGDADGKAEVRNKDADAPQSETIDVSEAATLLPV